MALNGDAVLSRDHVPDHSEPDAGIHPGIVKVGAAKSIDPLRSLQRISGLRDAELSIGNDV